MVQSEQESKIEEQHLQNGSAAIESLSLETLSDSERTDTEIDRIIAETNMLESKTHASPLNLSQNTNGSTDTSRLEFEDEDAETLSMRLKLIESLQNKIASVEKEREDGEVTDEEGSGPPRPSSQTKKETSSSSRLRKTGHVTRKSVHSNRRDDASDKSRKRSSERTSSRATDSHKRHSTQRNYLWEKKSGKSSTRGSISGSDNLERRDRGSSSLHTSSSHRSKRQREETHGKTDTPNAKHVVSELSITLPSSQISPNSDFVISTLNEKRKTSISERIVEASSSHSSSENRSFKRVVDSGDHISVTVNAHRVDKPNVLPSNRIVSEGARPTGNNVAVGSASSPRSSISATVMNNRLSNDFDSLLPHIPLPPTPTPFRSQTISPENDKDFMLLPPPPAPPILPKPVEMVENCNPSSIRIQVREGGGRVAQLSTSAKPKEMASCSQKPKPPSVQCVTLQMEPQFSSEKTDNYEDVGMDVESSHSSCDSDTGHGDNEGIPSPRHRIISDADEAQLREMLLHQVILNRKRNAESAGQSSSASICDGRAPDGPSRANVSECGDEEETADVKNVLVQTSEEITEVSKERDMSNSALFAGSSGTSQCNSDEPPCKRRKVDEPSPTTGDDSSAVSPPPSSLSELNNLLKDKQSQLGELDSEISERMSCLDESLHRRAELKNQLAELEADIEAGQAQCRVLMRRRNVIRRAVERYEEHRLDRLLANDWDDEDTRKSQQSDRTSKSAESIQRTPSTASWVDVREDLLESGDCNEERKMRLKLLSRMRRGDTSSVNSGQDENNRDCPTVSAEEHFERSTQTNTDKEDESSKSESLYRSHNFPQRLKRFVGISPDLSVEAADCPNEMKGEKCTDVSCKSSHVSDGELTTTDVLRMMVEYMPQLIDSADDKDRMRQIDVLKSKRRTGERFGIFARRLFDECTARKTLDADQVR